MNKDGKIVFYLAGRVGKNDWRAALYPDIRGAICSGNQPDNEITWTTQRGVLPDGHHCSGPFFVSCDHGCYHGPTRHGMMGGCSDWELGYFDDVDRTTEKFFDALRSRRQAIFGLCTKAIADCDVVLAYIDKPDAYGTLVELGMAYAAGKTIVLFINPDGFNADELWLAEQAAMYSYRVDHEPGADEFELAVDRHRTRLAIATSFLNCESPIEERLLGPLVRCGGMDWASCSDDATMVAISSDRRLRLHQQYSANGYRLDFALLGDGVMVAVEADGHDYHERTKEQAEHDKSRDRALAAAGWTVLRFTGREIHRNAEKCAAEAIAIARRTGGNA